MPGTGSACARSVRAQVLDLAEVMATARRENPYRALDLVLLTLGANDVLFSGLMANVVIEPGTERTLLTKAGKLVSFEEVTADSGSGATPQFCARSRGAQAIRGW